MKGISLRMRSFILPLLLFFVVRLQAQVVDRYPYIQQPTETSVLVAWNTAVSALGTLHWGNDPGNLPNTLVDAQGTQKHAHTISNLQPNTQYFYQVTTDAGYTSAVEHFWTAKPIQTESIRFLHYGDCGYNNSIQNQLAGHMRNEDVDFAVVAGDVDQGTGNAYDNVFFGVYDDMLAHDCHYTAIGNHDIIANNGADFFDSFYQPTNNPQASEHYYSFTWGNAKFICLDSNEDYGIGSDQHDFLLSELQCRAQEWVFVFFHHPPWSNAWDLSYYIPFQPFYQYDGNDDMRTDLVPYFEQYDVDFVLNGHSHCYQRGELNGVHYVISGGAGSSTLDQHTCNTAPANIACSPNITTEIYVNQYVRFRIDGDTLTYASVDVNGAVVDSVMVTKTWTPYSASVGTTSNTSGSNPNGSATVTVQGPFPPFTYAWSNGATTATASGLAAGNYDVVITDAHGCTSLATATVDGLTGTEGGMADHFRVYPNPFDESCQISFSNTNHFPMTLELLDMAGRSIRKFADLQTESFMLEREGLEAGIYLLRLRGDGQVRTIKVAMR